MKTILIIGAGRSASYLINYLLTHAEVEQWKVRVGDIDLVSAKKKINGSTFGEAFIFNIHEITQREHEIKSADLVISMLPASMHIEVAKDCVKFKKHLVTASYVSKEIQSLNDEAIKNGVLLLNEIGLDPGIDHMSAMHIIDSIKEKGGIISSFKSYCGGLVAPESNNNPWGYKFSWNPRNVILAGQGTAQFKNKGTVRFIPYARIFNDIESIEVEGMGKFDGYANRDSLSYIVPYGIEKAETVLRGTLRYSGFCEKWNVFVRLGLTDDTFVVHEANKLTYKQFVESFLPMAYRNFDEFMKGEFKCDEKSKMYQDIVTLGLLSDQKIEFADASPAQILQNLLEKVWKLEEQDKDMIVMQHLFEYSLNNKVNTINSTLVVIGDDNTYTAMAKTVGLPMAIAAKMILKGIIQSKGVQIPLNKNIYAPILSELETLGIQFKESYN